MTDRSLLVAALQIAPVPLDPEATLEHFERQVHATASAYPGVQLVVAPELHLMAAGGLTDERDGWMEEVAVAVPGPLTERLGDLARTTGVWLIPGSVYERDGEAVYNTAVVLSPDGSLVTSYRKCFPWQPYETSTPGQRAVCFDIEGIGRFGLAICHDGAFPEIWRQLAWYGAEAVFQVTLTTTSDREAEVAVARANAIVNQFHVVNVNACAPAGLGRSVIVDPEGTLRYEAGSAEEVVTTIIDLEATRLARERGSFGLNRLLDEFDRLAPALELPMWGGPYRQRPDV